LFGTEKLLTSPFYCLVICIIYAVCRALAKYYKQNLVSRGNVDGRSVVNKVMSHYKALGWTGATGKQF